MVLSFIVSSVVLVFIIAFQGWQIVDQRKAFEKREDALLNRIMSPDYRLYVNAEVVKEQAKQAPQQPAYEEERGIPVI